MPHRFNDAQRWIQAATLGVVTDRQMKLEIVGGFERPAHSDRAAALLREQWGILTAGDAREMLAALAQARRGPEHLACDSLSGLSIAAWSYCAYLLKLEEAWGHMFLAARKLQAACSSWPALAEALLSGFALAHGEGAGQERLRKWLSWLLTDPASPWVGIPYQTKLSEAYKPPEIDQRVLTVDPGGGGDFATIGEALRAARRGDKLRVRSGTYKERLWIDTPVEIEGLGEVIVDNQSGCALMVEKSAAVITNISFRARTDANGDAMHGVIVKGNFLKLVGCDISADNFGVHVATEKAHVVMEECVVHDAGKAGIVVHDGMLVMEGGLVTRSKFANVQVEGITETRLDRVCFEAAEQSGLIVTKGANVVVTNGLFINNLAGVDATLAGRLQLLDCQLRGNANGGARAFGPSTQVLIESSQLIDNGAVNIGADDGAQVSVRESRVAGGACAGWADHRGRIEFTRCRVGMGSEGVTREMNGGTVVLIDCHADVQPRA